MLLKRIITVIVLSVLLISPSAYTSALLIHGEIIEIFPAEAKVRLRTSNGMQILQLGDDCEIYRHEQRVMMESLRPVTDASFQDAVFVKGANGLIRCVFVNYCVQEDSGVLASFDIFGNIKDVQPF